jgi:lysozyme
LGQEVKTSDKGLDLMHRFEGYRSKPYLCPAHIWTVGWGTVLYQEQIRLPVVRKEGYTGILRKEMPLKEGDDRVWSKEKLVALFKNDLASFERAVLRLVPGCAGHQSRFDALVCLAYNIGSGNLQRSTVRMRANRGDWDGAAEAFMMWVKGGGRVLPGLVRRRKAEIALFLS